MTPSLRRGLDRHLPSLNPAWFALVMATGIVAVAAHLEDVRGVPSVLFWMAAVFHVVLWLAYLARLVIAPGAHLDDLRE